MQNVNLYLVRRAPRRGPFSRPGLLLLAALALGAGTGWHLLEARRIDGLRTELKRLDADRERLQRQLAQVPSAGAALAKEIDAEERAVLALESVAQRLGTGTLARTGGFTDALRALARTQADGVWLAGLQVDNASGVLVLDGRAVDASQMPAYLAALRRDTAFAGTTFAAIDARAVAGDAAPLFEFTLRSAPLNRAGGAASTSPAAGTSPVVPAAAPVTAGVAAAAGAPR